jgi:hypothetical protein
MATLKERSDNWGATSIIRRDFRHAHEGGYEEAPYRKKKGGKKKYKKKGCPANNGKQHVYIWVPLRWLPDSWGNQRDRYDRYVEAYYIRENKWSAYTCSIEYLEKWEKKICCGCYQRPSWKTRASRKVG